MCDWLDGRTKVSRDIDQSQHPCMSRTGKRGIWRKSGRDIDQYHYLCMSRARERYGCEAGYIRSHFSQNNTTLRLYISKKVLILRMRLKIVEMDTLTKEEVQSFLEQFHAKLKPEDS